jgi:hypothetical protein
MIDASCKPADKTNPRDLKPIHEALTTTARIIDDLCSQSSTFRKHRTRYDRGLAGATFL